METRFDQLARTFAGRVSRREALRRISKGLVNASLGALGVRSASGQGFSPAPPRLSGLALSTGSLVPAFDPTVTEYTCTALGSLFPIEITAEADPMLRLTINGQKGTPGVALPLTLKPLEDIAVGVEARNGKRRTYTVRYLPPTLPTYTVTKTAPALMGGETIFLTPANKWLLVVDREGAPLYYRALAPEGVVDFKQHRLPGGKVVYSFAAGAAGADAHRVCLLDEQFRETGQLALLPNRDHDTLPIDPHDFLVLGEEHYVVIAYHRRIVDLSALNPAWAAAAPVLAAVVQEIDHGKVVFEWDSTDEPSLYADSVRGNAYTTAESSDYVHLNSIQVDPTDGHFILSLRHTNSVLKLDRFTGATLWTLGGTSDQFGLTAQQRFSHQHHARKLDNGTLTIFDNGNDTHPTRVISFVLDERNKRVTSFEVLYERPAEQADSTFMGSATRLDASRTLIGWGGRSDTTSTGPAVTEIVVGMPVWSLTFAASDVFSYRALPEGAS